MEQGTNNFKCNIIIPTCYDISYLFIGCKVQDQQSMRLQYNTFFLPCIFIHCTINDMQELLNIAMLFQK